MLLPADALKVQCAFVKKVLDTLTERKFVDVLCLDELYELYKLHAMAELLEDCLTYDQLCLITNKAKTLADLGDPVEPPIIITECPDQVTLTLGVTEVPCTYTMAATNLSSGNLAPKIVLVNDSVYHYAYLDVTVTSSCTDSTVFYDTATTGCVNLLNSPYCSDGQKIRALTFFSVPRLRGFTDGFVTKMRVYATDIYGIFDNTPIDLEFDIADLTPWTSCGTCSAIDPDDLKFGSANFLATFPILMENVSKTLYGDVYTLWNVSVTNTGYGFSSYVKHKPAGRWFGISNFDGYMQVDDGSGTLYSFRPDVNVLPGNPSMYETVTYTSPCGDVEGTLERNSFTFYIDQNQSNFDRIVLLAPNLSHPATFTTTPVTCST